MGSAEADLRRWRVLVVGVVAAVLVGAAALGYRLIAQLRSAQQHVAYDRAEELRNAEALGIAVYTRTANARGYLLSGDQSFVEARAAARHEIEERLARLLATARGGVAQTARAMTAAYERLDTTSDRAVAAYATSPEEARRIWEHEAMPVQQQIERELSAIMGAQRAAFDAARDAGERASDDALRTLVGLLVAIVVVISTLIYAYARVSAKLFAKYQAEQRLTTFRLIEQVPTGIFVITPDGKPFYANKYAKQLLGRGTERSDKGLALTFKAFEAGTDKPYPEGRLPIVRALAGERAEVTDMEIRRDKDVIPLHVVAAPVYDVHDKLTYAVAAFQDVRELQRVANRDALTGLSNRAAVMQLFQRESLLAHRNKRPLAVALIDLDRFKSINDTHGHAAGDDVLKRTAQVLLETFRRSDIVGRWGGEELVVLMPDTDMSAANRALQRALEATRTQSFRSKDEAIFKVTFSAGVVIAGADEKLDAVIARADVLLYAAKEAGRDRIITAAA